MDGQEFQPIASLEDYQKRFDEDYKVRFKTDFESGIKERLARQTEKHNQDLISKDKALLEKYGLENYETLDEVVNNGKNYATISEEKSKISKQLEELSAEKTSVEQKYQELNEKYLFAVNSVDAEQVQDLKAFFKGNNQDINETTLKDFLTKHPTFIKKSIKVNIGGSGDENNLPDTNAYKALKDKLDKKLKIK